MKGSSDQATEQVPTERDKLMDSYQHDGALDHYRDAENIPAQQRHVTNLGANRAPGSMQMAPLPGQSNFAMVSRESKGANDVHRSVVHSRHYGKASKSVLYNNHPLDHTNFNEIFIPREDKKSTGCCFRIFCPCYYLFCCCCCCEQGFKVTRMRFVGRFQKWINVVSTTEVI